ncbi:RNA 2',3'-cyclic phosphodiesterase [Sulfurovum sp. NBC37-1]|uniref:RNA 2',3'-cyclic phosphodiesterase n=1 Tax=Sulfurovum sp. (strain NBC37-1) TaxID=387093 RepID=UPI0002D33B5B|nr:RNA 2',3'-cyclic phosphodiesterase [Sulfurovum sp. NBC37-1]
MRLFIASPVRLENYSKIRDDFKDIMEGKWVEEENLHLTWVFLGNVPDERPVIKKMQKVSVPEREVTIAELGYFGRPPRVFFAKAEDRGLYATARTFKKAGFDLYRFKPHVTLCRIKEIYDYKRYKEVLKSYREKDLGHILPQITLYKSELSDKGPEYTSFYTL